MINFHPNLNDLELFVAGNCEPAMALIISAHVDMCAKCQQICRHAQDRISAQALNEEANLDDSYLAMMSEITELPQLVGSHSEAQVNNVIQLDGRSFKVPRALSRYVKKTGNWSHLLGNLWQAPVDLGTAGKANFIYMEKGGRVPEHTHKGTEMTLVIDGQYSDGIAEYDCGDFTILDSQHKHMPHSEADEGCLVFTIVDQPLHFTAGIARLLNPFSHLFFK